MAQRYHRENTTGLMTIKFGATSNHIVFEPGSEREASMEIGRLSEGDFKTVRRMAIEVWKKASGARRARRRRSKKQGA